ncbi:MAG: NAD-dependent epimerase/dehydratase family protein [Deltaproteobacteria bacterium]|nr:NAD-dependent epimerase/dehydratase family protein [Deltaproteobacteria bacterium]
MKVVAVTGHAGFIGQRFLRALEEIVRPDAIVGIDVRPSAYRARGLIDVVKDVRDPSLVDDLRAHGVDTMVHLAFILNPMFDEAEMASINLGGTENVTGASGAAGVKHLVAMSSATAYGAHRDNPAALKEDAALRAEPAFAYGYHKRRLEEICWDFARRFPGVTVTTLRPCIVLGPHVDNYISASFSGFPLAPLLDGLSIPWQFVGEDDVARAVALAVKAGLGGAFNVVGAGVLTTREMAKLRRVRTVKIPYRVAKSLNDFFWSRHLFPGRVAPSGILDYFRYPWVADGKKAAEKLGFVPSQSSYELFADVVLREQAKDAVNAQAPLLAKLRRAVEIARGRAMPPWAQSPRS